MYELNFIKIIREIFYWMEKSLRYILIIGIVVIGIVVISVELLNYENDTVKTSYYGFAIMMAYASICFSWARNQDKGLEKLAKNLNELAMDSLYYGIVFLLGSFFKYVVFIKGTPFEYKLSSNLYLIPMIFSMICLFSAVFKFCIISIRILKRIAEYKDNEFIKILAGIVIKGKKK